MGNDWLTDELMQRAAKLIQDIDGIASQGSIYVVSRALYEAEKRGREEAAKIAERDVDWSRFGKGEIHEAWEGGADAARDYRLGIVSGRSIAAAIRSGQ